MSDDLARARARKAADGWLRTAEPDRVHPAEGVEAERLKWAFQAGYLMCICEDVLAGDQLLLTAQVLDAAARGGPLTTSDMERAAKTIYAARDELALERATGQRQLDDATALMTEAHDLFRKYEAHHRHQASVADTGPRREDREEKANTNALMAARLDAWLKGKDAYPVSLNPADALRQIGEQMVDGETIKGVDHETFDRAAAMLNEPVSVQYIEPDDPSPFVAAMFASIDEISSLPVAPAQSLAETRRHWAEGAGFKYWPGGDGPPADLDKGGEVIIDWGEQTESGPRFTICSVEELTPMPGLWAETIDPESFGTIIGYHAIPTAKPATPAVSVAAEASSLAALIKARNWLLSAESLIAEAAAHIRSVTGANPGSDSADLCDRLDGWLTPMATRPADEGAEKEARRSSMTHQGG